MSDYHILESDVYGNESKVVMHFAVPAGNNAVGVAWQTIQAILWANQTSIVPTIESAEQAELDAGALMEHVYRFKSRPGESLVDKRAALDIAFESEQTRVLALLSNRLNFWGYARDVP